MKKVYLGDAVYAEYDGFSIILTTENGISTSNIIFLYPETAIALQKFITSIKNS